MVPVSCSRQLKASRYVNPQTASVTTLHSTFHPTFIWSICFTSHISAAHFKLGPFFGQDRIFKIIRLESGHLFTDSRFFWGP
jgi:hypothetical protein